MTRDLTPEEDAIVTDGLRPEPEPRRHLDWFTWICVCMCVAAICAIGIAVAVRNYETKPLVRYSDENWPCHDDEVLVIHRDHWPELYADDAECAPE